MRLADYIRSLDKPSPNGERALDAYATRVGLKPSYMRIHVLYARKTPRFEVLRALARESQGNVCLAEVLQHYGVPAAETVWPLVA